MSQKNLVYAFNAQKITKRIQDMGSTVRYFRFIFQGKWLIMDTLVIGLQLGRQMTSTEYLETAVEEMIFELQSLSDFVEQGQIPLYRKINIYDNLLQDASSNLISLLRSEQQNCIEEDFDADQIYNQRIIPNLKGKEQKEITLALDKQKEIQKIEDQSKKLIQDLQNQFEKEQSIEEESSILLALKFQQYFDEEEQLIYEQTQIIIQEEEEQIQKEYEIKIRNQQEKDQRIGVQQEEEIQQEQEEKNQRILEQDAIDNEPKDCNICLEPLNYDQIWPLQQCGHIFHRPCLNKCFAVKIKDRDFPLKCPDSDCKKDILYDDLIELVDEKLMDDYHQFTLGICIDSNFAWCPTPGCKYAFALEKGDFEHLCPECNKHYCLNCKVEYHQEQTCEEYRLVAVEDENYVLFVNFVEGSKFKECPNCKFWVEKSEGCNHMTCRCKYEFCYICGGQYPNCPCEN